MSVEQITDDGKVKILRLNHKSGAVCEIYTYGATVTKFKNAAGKDLIWLSTTAKLDGTKAIRGGIPLVFPQFGQPIKEMAQHGFARNNTWGYDKESDITSDDEVGVTLFLDQTMATHEAWPFPYRLEFQVFITSNGSLRTSLFVKNTGAEAFKFQCLQHTYLNVGDISKTSVNGLQYQRYLDKTSADTSVLNTEDRAAVDFKLFTDRVYLNVSSPSEGKGIQVSTGDGTIQVEGRALWKDGNQIPSDTVVWNPWEEKAKGMGDFDDDGYLKMLCIEPGLVADFHLLPPGGQVSLVQSLSA